MRYDTFWGCITKSIVYSINNLSIAVEFLQTAFVIDTCSIFWCLLYGSTKKWFTMGFSKNKLLAYGTKYPNFYGPLTQIYHAMFSIENKNIKHSTLVLCLNIMQMCLEMWHMKLNTLIWWGKSASNGHTHYTINLKLQI